MKCPNCGSEEHAQCPLVVKARMVDLSISQHQEDQGPFMFLRPPDVKRMVERMLGEPCPTCGGAIEKKWIQGVGLDLVCTAPGCTWSFPVDTGPFPISGRRVD